MNAVNESIYSRVLARKHELMKLTPNQLRALPPHQEEEFTAGGRTHVLVIWHDRTEVEVEDIVVVQCKREIALGIGTMFAEGFVLEASNRVRDAEEKLLWGYK